MLKQLSGLDSMFLYAENSRMPLEVSSLHIYDPSTAPNGKVRFKEILATIDERLERAQIFHRKILELPFSLDHPYWVEDENFDIEFHVRHIALPKPGDWRQLMILVSRLQSRELDKSRPLWEAYVIEGLDKIGRLKKGCFAVFLKMHHATVDGVSGAALQQAIHDLEPIQSNADNYEPGARETVSGAPSVAKLVAMSPINNLRKSANLALGLAGAIPRLIKAKIMSSGDETTTAPPTVFNRGRVTANRVIDGCVFALSDYKAIARTVADAKINDVALAVVSGALRRYLAAKDDLPETALIAACPLNVRSDSSADASNMVSMMNTSLCTQVPDAAERLAEIVKESGKAKRHTETMGAETLTTIPMNLPAFVAESLMPPLMNLATRFNAFSFNTIVSNVAGIQQPLYFCGAKLIGMHGVGPVVDQGGLFHAVFSYDGQITTTFTACREMMPDPEFYAECIQASFDELKQLTAASARKSGKKPGKKSGKKSGKKRGNKKRGKIRTEMTDDKRHTA